MKKILMTFILAMATLLWSSHILYAQEVVDPQQLSMTEGEKLFHRYPQASGDFVVWEGRKIKKTAFNKKKKFRTSKLFLYDLTTDGLVALHDEFDARRFPSLSGHFITYVQGHRYNRGEHAVILCEYDTLTQTCFENTLSSNLYFAGPPKIDGHNIIWVEKEKRKKDRKKLLLCNYINGECANGKEVLVSKFKGSRKVSFAGDLAVWAYNKGKDRPSSVSLIDINRPDEVIALMSNPSLRFGDPIVSGTTVVVSYRTKLRDHYGIKICEYDTETQDCSSVEEVPLDPVLPWKNRSLRVGFSGKDIVWEQKLLNAEGRTQTDIFTFKIGGDEVTRLTDHKKKQSRPAISGGKIVFEDRRFDTNRSDIALLMNDTIEGVVFFGEYTNSTMNCPGPIEIGVSVTPVEGDDTFMVHATGTLPNVEDAFLVVGEPFFQGDLAFGSIFYIDLTQPFSFLPATVDAGGMAEAGLPLTNYVAGDLIYAQMMFRNPSECGDDEPFSTSNPIEITVQSSN